MTFVRPCILCRPDNPHTAAPGWYACHHCADKLAGQLGDLADRYATLQEADELIPTSSGERGSPGFGPRSPAVDALLVHSDVRTRWTSESGYGALAVVESWARMIREETFAGVPAGRATMARELATIRWNWDYVMGAPWLDEFAREIRDVLDSLKHAGRLTERVLRIGPCPVMILAAHTNGNEFYRECGAILHVRFTDVEVRCRNCGTTWPRGRWRDLGDQWIDYAKLGAELGVPVGTLRRWCHEDDWTRTDRPGRPLVSRLDARASYERRRGPIPLEQAG